MPKLNLKNTNRLVADENDIATGKLISLEAVSSEMTDKKGDIVTTEQLEFIFEVENTSGVNSKVYLWTGVRISDSKNWYPEGEKTPTYNKLTTLVLSTGVVEVKDLAKPDLEAIDTKLNELVGQSFQFKLIPAKKQGTLKTIDVSSLKAI